MKKIVVTLFGTSLILGLLGSCAKQEGAVEEETTSTSPSIGAETFFTSPSDHPVELQVVTSFGVSNGYQSTFQSAYENFQRDSGHTVLDSSETANEAWKEKVLTSFQTGAEADVLYFYAGTDADTLIAGERVVSLEEIRSVYPSYGMNMKEEMLPISSYDGKHYTIPVNGYWQGLYINQHVLEEAEVPFPGADYTWEQFLEDCQAIKEAGYTPLSVSLLDDPLFWFEYLLLNRGRLDTHLDLPQSITDDTAWKWKQALEDMKTLYDLGFFPEHTLSTTWDDTTQLFLEDKAAFFLDSSNKIPWLEQYVASNHISVAYFPSRGSRDTTHIIGGISMGYYISRGTWDIPEKREAAVDFVKAMTTDNVVNQFGICSLSALKAPTTVSSSLSNLETSAISMKESATGIVDSVTDTLTPTQRQTLIQGIHEMLQNQMSVNQVLEYTFQLENSYPSYPVPQEQSQEPDAEGVAEEDETENTEELEETSSQEENTQETVDQGEQ